MAGLIDVARAAGVSTSTASRALSGTGSVSGDARSRVLAAAQQIGYAPAVDAVSLVTGRTRTIGVVVPYLNRWFFAEAVEGIQAALLDHRLDLVLYDAAPGTDARRRVFEDLLVRRRVDGLVAIGLEPDDQEISRLLALGKPVVTMVGDDGASSIVAIDDGSAVRRAIDHLVRLGHRDIAFLGGGPGSSWAHVDRRRLDSYVTAMGDAGLGAQVRHVPSPVTLPGGYAAAADLLALPAPPTAILGVCDEVAIGCIVAARRHGIDVPTDLSVIGVDDHEYAEMFSLTTIEQVPRAQGRAAVELLLRHLSDPSMPPERNLVTGRLILRTSTGTPPG